MPAFPREAWNLHTYQAEAAYATSPSKYLGHRVSNKPPWLAALHMCSHISLLGELRLPCVTPMGKASEAGAWTSSPVPFPCVDSDLYQINVTTILFWNTI